MRGFVLTAALGLTACSEAPDVAPYSLWVSPSLSVEQQAAARRACDRWNEVAGRTAVVVDGVGERDRMIVRGAPFPVHGADAQGYQAEHGVLIVASDSYVCTGSDGDQDLRCFEAVAMHEIGHLLGVPHVERGIMQERDVELEVSDEDRRACANATYCGGLTSPKK